LSSGSVRSRALAALLIAVLGLVIALPLVEVGARIGGLSPEVRRIDVTQDDTVYRRSGNPILAFELKPGWRDPDADLIRSYPFTNSHGQRDVERTIAKPNGVDRILLLGASVVEGVGLADLDDTIPRQLERRLGDGHEVLNFGVSAYCTRAKIELLRVKGLAFDPDAVVLFVSQNDFNNFNFEAFQLGAVSPRPDAAEWLFRRSHAFRALALRLNLFGYRAQVEPAEWSRDAIGDNNVVDGLAMFAELAEEHGFDPVVAIWPRFTDDAVEDTDPMPGASGRLIFEALAAMHGLPTLRFSNAFRTERTAQAPTESPRLRFTIGDRLHPNPYGAALAAAVLEHELPRLRAAFRPGDGVPDPAAIEAARRRGERDPTESRRLVNQGNTLLGEERVEEAIAAYREAIVVQPQLAEAHHNLGIALRKSGRLVEALAEFRAAAALAPELPDPHFNVGVTALRLGDAELAVTELRRAVELRPDFEPAQRELAAAEAARRAAGP
jgi:Flp pilus assembly protein TadD